MGVDTKLTLVPDVRVRDVALVIGALQGDVPKKHTTHRGTFWAENNAIVESIDGMPTCCLIITDKSRLLYQYEWGQNGEHGTMARSTSDNIALFVEVARFFGGSVDFNDCDNSDVDFSFPRPRITNSPEDGRAWKDFQHRLLGVQPLTDKQTTPYQEFAAYS